MGVLEVESEVHRDRGARQDVGVLGLLGVEQAPRGHDRHVGGGRLGDDAVALVVPRRAVGAIAAIGAGAAGARDLEVRLMRRKEAQFPGGDLLLKSVFYDR